jgi:hypothetical protein
MACIDLQDKKLNYMYDTEVWVNHEYGCKSMIYLDLFMTGDTFVIPDIVT